MRAVTINLLHGRETATGHVDAEVLAKAITTLDADVLGVQEVDRLQRRSGGLDEPSLIAAASGARWWRYVPSVRGTPGPGGSWRPALVDDGSVLDEPTYGLALFSRYPVVDWRVLRFPPSRVRLPLRVAGRRGLVAFPDEPRTALAARVEAPGGPLTVATAHLSFVPGVNARQLRRVAGWLQTMPGPRLLLGDLNLPGRVPSRLTRWEPLVRAATYPAWRPRVQWDHVLAHGFGTMSVTAAAAVELPVSDHRALQVDLDLE